MPKVIITLLLFFVVACAPKKAETPDMFLVPGMVQVVKAYGEHFSLELLEVEKGVAVWQATWDEQIAFKQKLFQNIFPVWGNERYPAYYNDFDHEQLAPLFPLEVGKEVVFEGSKFARGKEEGNPFWAAISVVGSDSIVVDEQLYSVVVIEITIEEKDGADLKRSITKLWHATELGLNLKTKHVFGGHKYFTHVASIKYPDGLRQEKSNVGTTLINYEPKDSSGVELSAFK